jgi:ubiquitin C-terminal hydrolase
MLPEILVCLFNNYSAPVRRFIPETLSFPAGHGGVLTYRRTASIEHSGSAHSGHYTARALRAGGAVHWFNDSHHEISKFDNPPGTFIVMYHLA